MKSIKRMIYNIRNKYSIWQMRREIDKLLLKANSTVRH